MSGRLAFRKTPRRRTDAVVSIPREPPAPSCPLCRAAGAGLRRTGPGGGGTTYPGNYENRPIMNSMLSIIVEPTRLGGGDNVGAEANRFVDWVKSSKPLPGVEVLRAK